MAWLRFVLPVLAVAALVPAFWHSNFASTPQRVPFFADGLARSCIPTGETLVVFPFGVAGDSMLWQAEAGIRFRLAEGYLWPLVFGAKPPSTFDADPTVYALDFIAYESLPTMDALLAFAATHDVARFVSVVGSGYPSARQLKAFGSVEQIGGVSSRRRAANRRSPRSRSRRAGGCSNATSRRTTPSPTATRETVAGSTSSPSASIRPPCSRGRPGRSTSPVPA